MSTVYWKKKGTFGCPHCLEEIEVEQQESSDYGITLNVFDKKGDLVEIRWESKWG